MLSRSHSRFALGALAAYESALYLDRLEDRKAGYLQARARSTALSRPLVIVGDPGGGVTRGYPCGDITIDLNGSSCPRSIAADITKPVTQVPDNSAVVFVSCVFEYVSDANAAYAECLRMAGGPQNLFVVRVQPWAYGTSVIYRGQRWAMHYGASGPYFTPVSGGQKLAVAVVLAALIYGSVKSDANGLPGVLPTPRPLPKLMSGFRLLQGPAIVRQARGLPVG